MSWTGLDDGADFSIFLFVYHKAAFLPLLASPYKGEDFLIPSFIKEEIGEVIYFLF